MNVKKKQITQLALEKLIHQTGLTGRCLDVNSDNFEGKIEIRTDSTIIVLNAIVKQEIRNHQLASIVENTGLELPVILISNRIFPGIKEELRQHNIAYLETNGNLFIKQQGLYLFVDTNKSAPKESQVTNRAFTKTGIKILYHFLLNESLINKPYREIAQTVDVGLGNINYVINGLKELGFLLKLNTNEYKLTNKKELFEKWVDHYNHKLKPDLRIGNFSFVNKNDFSEWQNIELNYSKTCWGGEAAGDLLTHYLRPEILTIYTCESRNELIKNYKLIPDINGKVEIYNLFWEHHSNSERTVNPLITYADLIIRNDKRCLETANLIYEKHIKPNL